MNKKIYLDYAASTPVIKEVFKEMEPYFCRKYGNASSLHSFGQEAIKAVDSSREKIAQAISSNFNEIIFTSSATEANNLALRGVLKRFKTKNTFQPKIIISAIEHESILQTAVDLEKEGVEVVFLPVNKNGTITVSHLSKELTSNTVLVSIMYVNNEIGSVINIPQISKVIKNFRQKTNSQYPLLHSDAAQAFMYFDCNVNDLGVDLMTLSSQKIYGPKGAGVLYVNSKIKDLIAPIITGGGQEFKIRSGTENVPAIVGMGKAVELASQNREKNKKYVEKIKNYFWINLKKIYKRATINGSSQSPHILNIDLKEEIAFDFSIALDILGIAVSLGSACQARAYEPSYVLKAIGKAEKDIRSSVRFSFGITTTKEEIDETIKRIKIRLKKLKGA